MSKKRVGLLGCGNRNREVMKKVIAKNNNIEIHALYDPCEASINEAKETLNPKAIIYNDYHKLIQDENIDWVIIGSWNCFHAEQAVAAMKAGKNVFCEKPMATTFEDCLAMRDAHEQSNTIFALGLVMRYSPHFSRIHEIVQSGKVGQVISMEFNETLQLGHGALIHHAWRRLTKYAGSHLLEKCCHDIDLVNWILGSLPVRVASFGGCDFFVPENEHLRNDLFLDLPDKEKLGKTRNKYINMVRQNSPFTADKDIVDNQVVIIEYANKTRATFHTNCASAITERRMYINGSGGTVRANSRESELIYCPLTLRSGLDKTDIQDYYQTELNQDLGGHSGGDEVMTEELAAMIMGEMPPRASIKEGLYSSIPAFAIDKALETGSVVDIRPYWERAGIDWNVKI